MPSESRWMQWTSWGSLMISVRESVLSAAQQPLTDGVYSSGNIPKRNYYQNGRKNTGAGKREHPSVCFSSGNHGDLLSTGMLKELSKELMAGDTARIRRLLLYTRQPGRKRKPCVPLWQSWQRQRSVNILQNSLDRSWKYSGTKWL